MMPFFPIQALGQEFRDFIDRSRMRPGRLQEHEFLDSPWKTSRVEDRHAPSQRMGDDGRRVLFEMI